MRPRINDFDQLLPERQGPLSVSVNGSSTATVVDSDTWIAAE